MDNKYGSCFFQCFTNEQVKEINKKVKENIWKKQDPSAATAGVVKKGEFFDIPCIPLMDLIQNWLYQCQLINKNIFGYLRSTFAF